MQPKSLRVRVEREVFNVVEVVLLTSACNGVVYP
jgi:hypothetical protein